MVEIFLDYFFLIRRAEAVEGLFWEEHKRDGGFGVSGERDNLRHS